MVVLRIAGLGCICYFWKSGGTIGCAGQALQCDVTANLHPRPTWEEKQKMTYTRQITGAVPSASLEHFSFSNGSRQTSDKALDNVIVNLDGTVPAIKNGVSVKWQAACGR